MEKESISGGKADGMTIEQIAQKHGVSVESIEKQIEKGMKIETEHVGEDPVKTKEIAMDHLVELPDYYDRLEKMEEEGKKELSEAVIHEDLISMEVGLVAYILSLPLVLIAKRIINDKKKDEFVNTLTNNKDSSVNIKSMLSFIKKHGQQEEKEKASQLFNKIKNRIYTNQVYFKGGDIETNATGFNPDDKEGIKISYTNIKQMYQLYKKIKKDYSQSKKPLVKEEVNVDNKQIVTIRLIESDILSDDADNYLSEIFDRAEPGELHREYLSEVSFVTQKERDKMANKYSTQKTIEKESGKFSLGRLAYIFAGFTGLVLKSIVFTDSDSSEQVQKLNFIDKKKYKHIKQIVSSNSDAMDIADEIERELNEEDPDKEKLKSLKKKFVQVIRDELKKEEMSDDEKVKAEEKELDKKLSAEYDSDEADLKEMESDLANYDDSEFLNEGFGDTIKVGIVNFFLNFAPEKKIDQMLTKIKNAVVLKLESQEEKDKAEKMMSIEGLTKGQKLKFLKTLIKRIPPDKLKKLVDKTKELATNKAQQQIKAKRIVREEALTIEQKIQKIEKVKKAAGTLSQIVGIAPIMLLSSGALSGVPFAAAIFLLPVVFSLIIQSVVPKIIEDIKNK
jgi:hypothetical protein